MKKFLSFLTLLTIAFGFSAKAYECPDNLYFYLSNGGSTEFTKNETTFTYTVDATESDIYGVIVDYAAADWDEAHGHTAFFANGKWGDIEINGPETWSSVSNWGATWSNGCYKFIEGKKYTITLNYADGAFTGAVTVEGEEGGNDTPDVPVTGEFSTEKDYFIDASNCSWFFDGDASIQVWDGAENVICEKVAGSIVKFRPTATGTNGVMYVKRVDPVNGTTWNEYALKAPTNASHNLFVLNSNFNGGQWTAYSTPKAWVISQNINGWSAEAVSEYEFAYDEATELYTVSVPADKLRTDDAENNGFKIGYGNLNDWDNYYGAVIQNKVMGKGVVNDAVKNGSNFIIPASATTPVELTFNAKEGKLTADWKIEIVGPVDPIIPEDTEDVLVATVPTIDVNGTVTVEVALQTVSENNYCNGQWEISVPAGYTVSDITLNSETCPDHELATNTVDGVIKCMLYSTHNTPLVKGDSPLFTFTLTADNVAVGEATGSISNILFSIPPQDDNMKITSKFADATISINAIKAVSKIIADPANLALSAGASQTINLTFEPADATDQTVTWEVINGENIIDVVDGTVTAKVSGVATIKVTANDGFGASVTIDVTVDGKKVENIELSATEHTMYIGETLQLTATVTPDDATNKSVMWVSSDDNVATVDADGLVTGVAAGEATIYAVAKDGSGVEASCTVTIKSKVSGDADGDDMLTIADIVIIVKKVIGIDTEGALMENMDIDRDGVITTTDVTLAVYYLNQQTITEIPAFAQFTNNVLSIAEPICIGENLYNIPVSLAGATNVAGIQVDIVMPEGLEITSDSYVAPEASNGHNISVTPLGDNTYRVVIYSAFNFNNEALGYLTVRNTKAITGTVNIGLNNAMYSNGNNLLAANNSNTTVSVVEGVESIFADDPNTQYDVYNTAGVRVATNANKAAVKALPAGIYIIGNKKAAVY